MPIPSSYRLTSYLLLKCSLSPFGVPWNDCFVFNYYPYRINTTKKNHCVFMVLLVLARACRVANCQPLPAWLQAQTSCHNFTFVNAAGVAWQCWTRSDSRSRVHMSLGSFRFVFVVYVFRVFNHRLFDPLAVDDCMWFACAECPQQWWYLKMRHYLCWWEWSSTC